MISSSHVSSVNYLRSSGYIVDYVESLLLDVLLKSIVLEADHENTVWVEYLNQNKLYSDDLLQAFIDSHYMSIQILKEKVMRPHKLIRFRELMFGNLVNSLYLNRKSEFDIIAFNMLRCRNSHVMQEIYFRLKDGEETWAAICRQLNPDNPNVNPLHGPAYKGQFSPQLITHLSQFDIGQLSTPQQIGGWSVVTRVEKVIPSKLDDKISSVLLRDHFEAWFSEQKGRALKTVRFVEGLIEFDIPPAIHAASSISSGTP